MDTTQLKPNHIILSGFVYIAGVKVLQNRNEECCFARETSSYIRFNIYNLYFVVDICSQAFIGYP